MFDDPQPPTTVLAWTDGSCLSNPGGRSGAAVLIHRPDSSPWTKSQGFLASTNQRMELFGLLMALEACQPSDRVLVRSDSLYAVDGFRKHQSSPTFRLPTSNRDLWLRIQAAAHLLESVETQWIKGHSGEPGNTIVDALAGEAAEHGPWILDQGFRKDSSKSHAPISLF